MPEASPKGQAVESVCDLAGRVTQTLHKETDGAVAEQRDFAYDLAGNVLTASDVAGDT